MKTQKRFLAAFAMLGLMAVGGAAKAVPLTVITFDEFPSGTVLTNQYAGLGVLFSNNPIITGDSDMPNTPVLSPNPPFAGVFDIEFLTSTTFVQFDSGYWNTAGTGKIDVYDKLGNLLTSVTNTAAGTPPGDPFSVETFTFQGIGVIGKIVFDSTNDPAGADIDNLTFNVPEPGTLLLFGLGAGLMGLRRRRA